MKPASTSKLPPTPMMTGTSRRSRWRSHQVSLKGVGMPTNSMWALARPDFLDDARVIVRAEVAVVEAGDLDAGVLRLGIRSTSVVTTSRLAPRK